ncbi:hypothetical protein QBC34DRAFT_103512 [Podospora aff. communis PSN243]|uniref:NACHT domain-containing protein n=1 Tax=Podospora aff. communis PSN243 TaxID=3040156 RepID=A0AAV9H4Q5_9PEZI|nr:hypothetical protein QBC34DRAFT_103512 [Podospora aff. communis PSN243]
MEPLSALGLAANVAQLLDIGISVVRHTKEIADAGSTIGAVHLNNLADDIESASSSLTKRLKLESRSLENLSLEEKALRDIASKCITTAGELSEVLGQVTRAKPSSTWRSVLAAVQTVWSQARIEAIARRLLEYRDQLSLRILLVVNQQQASQQKALSALRDNLRDEIVEVIAITSQGRHTRARQHHPKSVTAILTTRNGESTALLPSSGAGGHSGHETNTSVTFSRGDILLEAAPNEGIQHRLEETWAPVVVQDVVDYKKAILDSLHFRGIADRRSSVKPAHANTFEWAWSTECLRRGITYKASLSRWLGARSSLSSGGGCYWISGKAGSGKSSLMKYLQGDLRLGDSLRRWAGEAEIVVPSFYFWYAGTPLQKSQEGLLRSLLFDVLSKRPGILPTVFPDLCRAVVSGKVVGEIVFSHPELKAALTNLVQNMPDDLHICFLVDGIDEYTGDHNEICDLFLEVTKHARIKALLSSRPIPACVHRFENCPKLRLQDLTREDIELYVQDHLGEHSLMNRMEHAEPGTTTALITKVTDRASGVFLWVFLVVRNLQVGLQNYNSASDLMEEVDRLPPDLEELYDHMLGSMPEQHRIEGSKLLQLALRSFELCSAYPMTALQLSFAEEDDYTTCLTAPVQALDQAARSWRCEFTEGRLRSRCSGLLEVQRADQSFELLPEGSPIGFLHRTVVEFLQTDVVWEKLRLMTSNTSFDAEMALMSSSVAELKAMPIQDRGAATGQFALARMARMANYEPYLNERGGDAFHGQYLQAMRATLGHHWHDKSLFRFPSEEVGAVNFSCARGCKQMGLQFPYSLVVSLSLQDGSQEILPAMRSGLDLSPHTTTVFLLIHFVEEKQPRLRIAMAGNLERMQVAWERPGAVSGSAAEALWNKRWKNAVKGTTRDWTPCEFLLHHCLSIMDNSEDGGFDFTNGMMVKSLLRLLLRLASSLSGSQRIMVAVKGRGRITRHCRTLSALGVILCFLQKVWLTMSKTAGAELDDVANLSHDVEQQVRRAEAEGRRRLGREVPKPQAPAPSLEPEPVKLPLRRLAKGFLVRSPGPNLATEDDHREDDTPDPPQPYVPKLLKKDEMPKPGAESPWTRHKTAREAKEARLQQTERRAVDTASPGKPSSREEVSTSPQWRRRWETTPRGQRAMLLSEKEQALVSQLAKGDMSAKEKRRIHGQLSSLPVERQEMIIECSKSIGGGESKKTA